MKITILVLAVLGIQCAHGNHVSRIVGGTDAKPHSIPYQASIQKWDQHFCGGSILSNIWVLTAGHCHYDDIENIKVVGGAHDLRKKNGHEQVRDVAVFVKHADYPGGTEPNDISIIKLAQPFDLNKYVQQIGLMSGGTASGKGLASGWGTNVADDPNPKPYPVLQQAMLEIHSFEKCHSIWRGDSFTKSQICAGPIDSDIPAVCSGDSGGPIVITSDGNKLLAGVASWAAVPCGTAPGVFTFVPSFIDWIQEQIANN
eukprot:GHVU01213386.1.p1 GENE.GHVU01213386.1~~GHVU01213386.1.p1  ORF type:complete len:265 (+),score=15.89 GHVU01213386.1:25-795(+)